MSHIGLFWSPIGENLQKKTLVQGRIASVYQDKNYSNSTPEAMMLCSEISVLQYIHIYPHQM
jgi:hypothetical protein